MHAASGPDGFDGQSMRDRAPAPNLAISQVAGLSRLKTRIGPALTRFRTELRARTTNHLQPTENNGDWPEEIARQP